MSGSLRDKEFKKFKQLGDNANAVLTCNIDPFGSYDRIAVTYPISTQEVYTYSLDGSDIGSITVNYTDDTKSLISEVLYNGV